MKKLKEWFLKDEKYDRYFDEMVEKAVNNWYEKQLRLNLRKYKKNKIKIIKTVKDYLDSCEVEKQGGKIYY